MSLSLQRLLVLLVALALSMGGKASAMMPHPDGPDDAKVMELSKNTPAEGRKKNRPELNGRLLQSPQGSVWLVINGRAMGFPDHATFLRLIETERATNRQADAPWGGRNQKYLPNITLTPVASIDFIEDGNFDKEARMVVHPQGSLAIYTKENGVGLLYGITSGNAKERHHLRHGVPMLPQEWNSYKMIMVY